jgi:hypothetical protein
MMKTGERQRKAAPGGQEGFALVLALAVMLILSVLGISAMNTTILELKIAGNDLKEKQIFYGSESGCARGGQWLMNLQLLVLDDYVDDDLKAAYIADNNYTNPMGIHQLSPDEVYSHNVNGVTIPAAETTLGDDDFPVKYTYDIKEATDAADVRLECQPIPGNAPTVLDCYYEINCSALVEQTLPDGTLAKLSRRDISVRAVKPTDFKN